MCKVINSYIPVQFYFSKIIMNCLSLGRSDDLCRILILDPYIGYKTWKVTEDLSDAYIEKQSKIMLQNYMESPDINKHTIQITDFAFKNKLLYKYSIQKLIYFSSQAKLYYRCMNPESFVKIIPCVRYTLDNNQGVTVIAMRDIKKNMTIKSILGTYKKMKPYEEEI